MHTLEVVIALAILATAYIGLFSNIQTATPPTAPSIMNGYAALHYLDYTGGLRPAAAAADVAAIRAALRPLVSNFDIEICDPACAGIARSNVAALDYYIAGYNSFSPKHIRMYLWSD